MNKSWWQNRHHDNVLICFYEEMKRDLRSHVVKVANFLGKDMSSAQIDKITEVTSFSSMKKNPSTNYSAKVAGGKEMENSESALKRGGLQGRW